MVIFGRRLRLRQSSQGGVYRIVYAYPKISLGQTVLLLFSAENYNFSSSLDEFS